MSEKRFTPYKNNDRIVGFKDNITGKHHCSIIEARWLLNHFWEKTQRLTEENIGYEEHIEDLTQENKELKERVSEVDNELEIRDIVCGAGKFRLEEWGKHRYHQFYKGDEELEDETVVIMLMELEKENKELKIENELLSDELEQCKAVINKKWSEYLKKKELKE